MIRVFVYGTLLTGEKANEPMLKNSKKLHNEAYLYGFKMYGKGKPYPFISESKNKNDVVTGEIYEVGKSTADSLDYYEGIDFGLYSKQSVHCETPDGIVECLVYVVDKHNRLYEQKNADNEITLSKGTKWSKQ